VTRADVNCDVAQLHSKAPIVDFNQLRRVFSNVVFAHRRTIAAGALL